MRLAAYRAKLHSRSANLGQLIRAGFPAPPGCVVGAPGYAAFRLQSGPGERLSAILGDLDVEDTAALRSASE